MRSVRTSAMAALAAATMLAAPGAAAQDEGGAAPAPESAEDQASYGLGVQYGEYLNNQGFADQGLNWDLLIQGMKDAANGESLALTEEEMQSAVRAMQEQATEGIRDEFIEANKENPDVVTLDSGLQYEVLEAGDGAKPAETDTVQVHYQGTLVDGTVFDSSYDRGEPVEFPLNRVIKGWTEGLQQMPVGSKYRLYIPFDLAYGAQGSRGAIPPYANLIFEVELLEIVSE